MENLTDIDLLYLAQHSPKAIFISCIAFILLIWAIYLAVSNFKQIARMKTDYEEHINEIKEFNEKKTFK
jgi:hypothetical protein